MIPELNAEFIAAFVQIVVVDLVLAGDNAIVVGLVAGSVAPALRARVIVIGILAATLLRIGFALITVQLLSIIGLVLAGGILLLWVCWKLWRELRVAERAAHDAAGPAAGRKTFAQAIFQIVIADVSMSLDNVLAVAGIARNHPAVLLVFGLVLSIALMAFAATLIARLLEKHRWIGYVGLLVIFYVSLMMIWDGSHEILAVAMENP